MHRLLISLFPGAVKRELHVRLVLNSLDGCHQCKADSNSGWMPVSKMGELGSRACGNDCSCDLQFEDEA